MYAIVTVGVANGLKMLYFYDVDPATIYATIFVVLAAMYPLFDQLQLSLQFAKEMDKLEYNAHAYEEAKEQFRTPWQHQIASTLGLLVILFSPLGRHISRTVLERVLTGDTTNVVLWQELVFSAAIWTAYVATLLYVFYPNMQLLRKYVNTLMSAVVCVCRFGGVANVLPLPSLCVCLQRKYGGSDGPDVDRVRWLRSLGRRHGHRIHSPDGHESFVLDARPWRVLFDALGCLDGRHDDAIRRLGLVDRLCRVQSVVWLCLDESLD